MQNIHDKNYLMPNMRQTSVPGDETHRAWKFWIRCVWLSLLVVNTPATVLSAMQRSAYTWWWPNDGLWLGVAGVVCVLILHGARRYASEWLFENKPGDLLDKTMHTTHFVTVWVVGGYVVFDTMLYAFGWDVAAAFEGIGVWTPLLAALVGLIPSCGPQVIVTGLYLKGFLPFSALMANALCNDGDALFPALAVSPRAAFVATVYGMVPALLIGYALYFVWGM